MTKRLIKLNINDYVWVKLTREALEVLETYHENMMERFNIIGIFKEPSVDKNGWSKWQLHELMFYFGHHCCAGGKQMFKKNIIRIEAEFELDSDHIPDTGKMVWTKDPLPESPSFYESNYFFAELHKGDWLLSLENIHAPVEFEPNVAWWRRSKFPIAFPPEPEDEE